MKPEQIIILSTCILMIIDTGLFHYASMSQYFLFCASAILLFVFGLFQVLKKSVFHVSTIELIFFVYFLFLMFKGFTTNNEQYKLGYLVGCYLLFQGLTWLFKRNRLSIAYIKDLYILLAFIESIICILQWFGIIESKITLFKVSGTWESPNVTAMFIALCSPLLIEKIIHSEHKFRRWLFAIFFIELLALLSINCRTAYIGIAASTIIQCELYYRFFKKNSNIHIKRFVAISITLSLLIFLGLYGLYKMKQPSADGRLFIWKTSISMITEHPIKGYGYGLFEKEYNQYQNIDIQNEKVTKNERKNAHHIFVCYNDFLEQAIEGGIISAALYLSILLVALYQSSRQQNYISELIIGNVIWMSTVNFIIHATPLMFMSLIFLAYTATNNRQHTVSPKIWLYTTAFTGIMVSSLYIPELINKYHVQRAIKKATDIQKTNNVKALNILKRQEANGGTSECFWRIYGKYLLYNKDYEHAQKVLKQALEYTSNPSVQKDINRCNHNQAIKTIN